MAYTEQVQQDLIGLMVGMFDAAPGQVIFNDVADAYRAGADYGVIAETLANTDEFKSIYGSNLTDRQYVTRLVNNMLDGHVTDQDEIDEVVDLFVAEMNAGATRAQVALAAAAALRDVDPNDPVWGQAGTAFANKVAVSTYYSIDAAQNGNDLAELQAVLAGVDHTDASVDAAKAAIDGSDSGTGGGEGFLLEIGRDILNGTAGDDVFEADVVQNPNGAQVNTLGSGDRLDGGAGNDTLRAEVVHGVNYGGTNTAISARTESIENIEFDARNSDLGNDQSTVFVNASSMYGVQKIGSAYSDAGLVIQNLTTYKTAGANGRGDDMGLPSDLTITMSHTGSRNSNWDESDLHVFFAQNHLRPDTDSDTTASQANYWLADQDSDDFAGEPLQHIDRDGIFFTLNNVPYVVRPEDAVLLEANTWEEFAAGLQAEIDAKVALGDTDLAGVTVIVDDSNIKQTYTDAGVPINVSAITLVDSNGGVFKELGFTIPEYLTGEFNVYGRVDTLAPVTSTSEIIATNIELEKVGRGGEGGELVVGGMDKGNGTNNHRDVEGIEQFNVTVLGGEELPNSLSALRSTNNQLQIVNIVSDQQGADSYASLEIGNSNSNGAGLKDVRVVNAADFHGDLSISAEITTESFAKYVDLFDSVGNEAEDNVYFDYSLTGEGDNTIWLDVDMDLAAHEDFVLSVLTDGGDDTVIVRLDANGSTQNQYNNQSALDNVIIGTGAGDDYIWTPGNGDVTINAGAGDDVVYTDNDAPGQKAIWVTNAVDLDITNLLGAGTGSDYFLPSATLTVTFAGATGVTAGTAADGDNGFEATVSIPTGDGFVANHGHINQAIKDAINNDPVLNKLLLAGDRPNGSLVITSLIDGAFTADALEITVDGPTAGSINAGQLQQLNAAYKEFMNDSGANLATAADAVNAIDGQLSNLEGLYQGINGSSQANNGPLTVGSSEVQTIDFSDFVDVTTAGDFDVGGVTVTVAAGDDGVAIADKVAQALNGQTVGGSTGNVVASAAAGVVTITFDAADGNVPAVVVTPGTAVTEVDSPATAEQQEINFTGAAVTATGNFTVGGIPVNVEAGDDDAAIAAKVVAAINNGSGVMTNPAGSVTAALDSTNPEIVVVTFDQADGNVANIVVAAGGATITGAPATGTQTVAWTAGGTVAAGVNTAPVDTVENGVNPTGTLSAITGSNSASLTDNVINLGTGQDVVVLSTSTNANETIVWTGHNTGKNTIVNFSESGSSIDQLDFSAYLTTQISTSGSSSAASAQDVATTVQVGTASVNANEVVIVDFAALQAGSGVSANWDNLSASSLEAILNASGSAWNRATTSDLHTNSTNKAVFMIENGSNDGEYKIFDVSFSNSSSNTGSGFTVVDLVGVADFGTSIDNVTDANFV